MSAVSLPTKLSISKLYPGILDEYDGEKIRSERSEFLDKPSFIDQSVKVGAAERGTATHLFMQFCDFRRVEELGVDEEIERLVEERFITRAIADLIYRDKVQVFFKSSLYKMISESDDVIREKRFNTRLGAAQFTLDKSFADELKDETVLVQGVVDCVVRDKDGEYVLIDYKTDYLPNDYDRAVEILRERYENQLKYYKLAIERVMGVKVKENVIYSFSLGKEIYLSGFSEIDAYNLNRAFGYRLNILGGIFYASVCFGAVVPNLLFVIFSHFKILI
jgi:ATP-dependent helicase/nuclease subunit A